MVNNEKFTLVEFYANLISLDDSYKSQYIVKKC